MVYAVPLLVENRLQSMFDLVVVVTAPEDVRVERLVRRGMTDEDARARIRAQLSDEEREPVADAVIPNGGSEADLQARVDALWATLRSRAAPA